MKTLLPLAMVLSWLFIVGYSVHLVAENVAGAMDNAANLMAEGR